MTGPIGRLGVQFLNRAYSRENELRADSMSVRLGTAAGYDPSTMIDLFLRFEPLQDNTPLSGYFSTHPLCRDRIENINKILRNNPHV